jgi:hypothetical protein
MEKDFKLDIDQDMCSHFLFVKLSKQIKADMSNIYI